MAANKLTPVYFFSHGSTMMLGEESASADCWKQAGDAALANGVRGIVIMGAHWDTTGDRRIDVATNPRPGKSPVAFVHPRKYVDYPLTSDPEGAAATLSLLNAAGFDARPAPTADWIHDVYLILIRMFPAGTAPPTTVLSLNARFDPHEHAAVGAALRPLRASGYLLVGSGGAVHNLYRNRWLPMLRFSDSFAQDRPPAPWALEFRQAVEDALLRNRPGPALRRAVLRLSHHPRFRDAHATDDHLMALMFVAGAAGDVRDGSSSVKLLAETWELTNMCNSQYRIGEWPVGDEAE